MRSEASHPGPHQTCVPAPCLRSPRKRCHDCFSLTALERSAAFCRSQLPIRVLTITNPHLLRWPAAFPCFEKQGGEEAATPGQPARARAQFLEVFPPAIRFRESPAATGLPQSSGKLRNSHVSLQSISPTSLRRATKKHCRTVQNLWTIRLPCGQTRKTKNDSRTRTPKEVFQKRLAHPSRVFARGWGFRLPLERCKPAGKSCRPSISSAPRPPERNFSLHTGSR